MTQSDVGARHASPLQRIENMSHDGSSKAWRKPPRRIASSRRDRALGVLPLDISLIQASPPDRHEFHVHGVANLYGKTLRERARALYEIAHPDHRESLEKDASKRFKIFR